MNLKSSSAQLYARNLVALIELLQSRNRVLIFLARDFYFESLIIPATNHCGMAGFTLVGVGRSNASSS